MSSCRWVGAIRRWVLRLTLVGFSLVLVEVSLRLYLFHKVRLGPKHPFAIPHFYGAVDELVCRKLRLRPLGIWVRDGRLGYAHRPSCSGVQKTPNYHVTYTIGPEGERVAPAPSGSVGRVVFLGDSFTFGQGVTDSQAYPSVLGRTYWTNWTVVNKAVMGWGTAHAYLVLLDELKRRPPPSLVIYGMLHFHVGRNYINNAWVSLVAREANRAHPHFEVVNGELQYRGVVDDAGSVPDSPEVRRKELIVTGALLGAMAAASRESGVPLVVVMLPDKGKGVWPASVTNSMARHGLRVLDLTNMDVEGFPTDGHPNAEDYAAIAREIAGSFVTEILGDGSRR